MESVAIFTCLTTHCNRILIRCQKRPSWRNSGCCSLHSFALLIFLLHEKSWTSENNFDKIAIYGRISEAWKIFKILNTRMLPSGTNPVHGESAVFASVGKTSFSEGWKGPRKTLITLESLSVINSNKIYDQTINFRNFLRSLERGTPRA